MKNAYTVRRRWRNVYICVQNGQKDIKIMEKGEVAAAEGHYII